MSEPSALAGGEGYGGAFDEMTQWDILHGIMDRLRERWPEERYYSDYAPQNFERPAFLVEVGKVAQEEAGGYDTRFTMEGKITIFLPVDPYHHSHVPSLCDREAEVMSLFGRGYFPAGRRNPHVDRITADHGYDYAEVILSISFNERWEPEEEEYPLLQSVSVRIRDKGPGERIATAPPGPRDDGQGQGPG